MSVLFSMPFVNFPFLALKYLYLWTNRNTSDHEKNNSNNSGGACGVGGFG